MKVQSPIEDPEPQKKPEFDMRAALIAELGLTDLAVEKIYEVMASMNITFADAATRLGLLGPDDFEEAAAKVQKAANAHADFVDEEETGLIETAIRRISLDRRVVQRQGERVKPGPKLILAHEKPSVSPLLGVVVDYAQIVPRGAADARTSRMAPFSQIRTATPWLAS